MSSIFPIHYYIKIEPDFTDFTFKGRTIIDLEATRPTSEVIVNAADLKTDYCVLKQGEKEEKTTFTYDYNAEELTIKLPEKVKGKFVLEFDYTGEIKSNLKGLYKTTYKVNNEVHAGAITQFETEDARRMFPSFDEPGMKATFDLEVLVEKKFMAISNTPIKSEKSLKSGKRWVTFETTPKMSTYLLFLGLAEFEFIEDKLDNIQVRVIAHPGLTKYGKDALDFGKKSLDYSQKYFNISFPLPKLDLIATPEFAAGAMENWGAISFRENLLLVFPGSTSKRLANRVKNVIAHEIAHQWFGNLVSPSIWKYIWLNESFADFFANKVVDSYHPELKIWEDDLWSSTSVALDADAYKETVPIEIASVKKTSYNIKSIPIIYNKGGAILRMVEDFVGKKDFQTGLQNYLNEFAYDVASSDDLWLALEKASNKPVSKLMKTWVLQPGYPLITVTRDGSTLKFNQKRFTFLGHEDETLWMVPISILLIQEDGKTVKKDYLLENKEGSIDTGVEFKAFKINIDQVGFYHVKYESSELNLLKSYLQKPLTTIDCYNLVSDVTALLIAREVSLDYYLDFIMNYSSTNLTTSIRAISDTLYFLYLVAEDSARDKITKAGITFHEDVLSNIGYKPSEKDSFEFATMRNNLLISASVLGSQKAIDFALEELKNLKEGKKVSADIMEAILSISARQTNDFHWFINKFDNANNEVEIINYGNALGDFSDEKVLDTVLEETLFTKIPMRNQAWVIKRLTENPYALPKVWKFFIANLDNIGKMHEMVQGRVINFIVSNCLDDDTKADMEKFFTDYNKQNPVAKITTEKSFETLNIRFKLRKHLNQ